MKIDGASSHPHQPPCPTLLKPLICPTPVISYEEDVRVPFFMRGPGVPEGLISDYQATMMDVAATLVTLAGGDLPNKVDGLPIPFSAIGVGLAGPVKYVSTSTTKRKLLEGEAGEATTALATGDLAGAAAMANMGVASAVPGEGDDAGRALTVTVEHGADAAAAAATTVAGAGEKVAVAQCAGGMCMGAKPIIEVPTTASSEGGAQHGAEARQLSEGGDQVDLVGHNATHARRLAQFSETDVYIRDT